MKTFLNATLVAAMLFSPGAYAQDVFIGTISMHRGRAILKRCDLGETSYLLTDREDEPAKPLATFVQNHGHEQGFWYAEVFGIYKELDGQHSLSVIDIQNLQAGRSCHLRDALKAMESKVR